MTLPELAQLIQDSPSSTALRESLYAFPVVEGIHLVGLALSFGLLLFTDLRLIGLVFRQWKPAVIVDALRHWIFVGFGITFLSGFALLWAEPVMLLTNPPFLIKVGLMVLGLLNALAFELQWVKKGWGDSLAVPAAARFAGWASLSVWTLVTIAGRLIPYYPS
jgi:hypothetical protein